MYRLSWIREIGNFKTKGVTTLLFFICLVTACVHAPAAYRPNNWVNHSIDLKSVADPPGQSLLQVIIVYGHWWSHHTALRLVYPDRPVLFWDPGGGYGVGFPEDVRSKDLIRINPPDLETYLQHIWQLSSLEVELFEWDLKPEEARDLYDVLLNGTDKNHPAGWFTTTTMGFFCTAAVSDFLRRFVPKTLTVSRTFFLPEHLAQALYTQSPKRVLAFRRGRQTVYFPPRIVSGDSNLPHISK